MNMTDIFLGCFVFGLLWSLAAVVLGGFHSGGHHAGASHGFHFHSHSSHGGHSGGGKRGPASMQANNWSPHFLNLHTLAIFLAWTGGCGYLMTRHTGLSIWLVLLVSGFVGVLAGAALAFVMRFLHGREFAMHPADYDMIGVLGRISSPVRSGGTGEMTFTRDGGRQLAYVRSENGGMIERGQEVVVTSFKNGIAYVRTWDALTAGDQPAAFNERDRGLGAEDAPMTRG
ncbi:MAG: hypothetical protein ACJ74Y_04235 [Bryobacteraceae bacterium]